MGRDSLRARFSLRDTVFFSLPLPGCRANLRLVQLTNLLMLLASALWIRRGLLALDVVRDVANLAALAVLCYPNRLLSTVLPFSDLPSSLLWGVGFMEFLKSLAGNRSRSHALLSGLLMGAASLVRANGLLLVPVFLVRCLTWKREGFPRAAASMLLVAGVSVVVLPWSLRNSLVTGRPTLISTNGGKNLAVGNNASDSPVFNSYMDSLREASASLAGDPAHHWNEAEWDSYYMQEGTRYIREHPGKVLLNDVGKVAHAFKSDTYSFGSLESYTMIRFFPAVGLPENTAPALARGALIFGWALLYALLYAFSNAAYIVLCAVFLFLFFGEREKLAGLRPVLCAVAGIVVVTIVLTFGESRFKEPLNMMMLVAVALSTGPRFRAPEHAHHPGPEKKE